ncbi:MAG: autotransporter domain-containing protein [Pseudomonadota bacterium]
MKISALQVFLIITFLCAKSAFATAISGTYNSDIGSPSSVYSSLEVATNGSATANQKIYSHQIIVGSSGSLLAHNTISAGSEDVAITLNSGYLELYSGSSVQGTIDGGGEVYIYGATSVGAIGSNNTVGAVYANVGETTFNGNINAYDFQILGSFNAIFTQASTAITVSNQLYIDSTATLSVTVSSSSSTILEVTGYALLEPGIKLNLTTSGFTASKDITLINVTDITASSTLQVIADSDINVNGNGTNIYNDATFTTSIDENKLMLHVTYTGITPSVTFTGNARNSYDAIINSTAASGELAVLKTYLQDNSISNSAKEAAAKSTIPQVDNANNRVSFDSAQASFDVASSRLQSLNKLAFLKKFQVASNSNNLNGLFDAKAKNSFWSQAFGSNISQGNTSVSEGYNANLKGLAFGADKEISNDSYLGISASYANSNAKSRSALKQTTINSYQFNVYNGINFEKFFLNNFVGFVWNDYDSNRSIPVATTNASAKYSGQTYIARSEIGANKKLENDIIFTPSLMITAAQNSSQNYSENGAGTLNLNVKSQSTNFFETRAGFALSKQLTIKDHLVFPEFTSSYGYDFAHSKQQTSANFIGQSTTFDSTSANIARGSLKIGLGAKIYETENLFFDTNYTFEHRQNFAANSIVLKVTKKF